MARAALYTLLSNIAPKTKTFKMQRVFCVMKWLEWFHVKPVNKYDFTTKNVNPIQEQVAKHTRSVKWCLSLLRLLFQLYIYEDARGEIIDPRFYERLAWNGSKHTTDLQDGSIYILNVTYNDTGTYKCKFSRTLKYSNYAYEKTIEKNITINVVARRKHWTQNWLTLPVLVY